jgi:TRAP-type C4-dicarboxylate transport system permease small subunit
MAVAAGLIFLFILLLVCYDVIMRYIFHNPTGWSLEVCEYLLVYLTFLGSPWLLREGGHVNVDILFFFLPKGLIPIIKIATLLVATIALFILFIFSAEATWDLYQRGATEIKILTVPKWILFWVIPCGSLFLGIESCRQFFSAIVNVRTDSKPENLSMKTGNM